GFNEYFQQSHPVCQINCADQINKNLMDNLKFANTTITHIHRSASLLPPQ
ncbi:hypothetical protein X975_21781, partial [Stegodyphus mimosarum]